MLGALPPWRGVAPYTQHLVQGLEALDELSLEFLDFSSLYPSFLYPGGEPRDGAGTQAVFERVHVRRLLAWYNPLSWVRAGLTLRGRVVHAQWWSYVLAPAYLVVLALARMRGKRIILTLHNVEPHEGGRVRRWVYQSVFRLAHQFIVHSGQNEEALLAARPSAAGRVAVVPLGLHGTATARPLSREAARTKLGLSPEAGVVLAFGNIRPYKGTEILLKAHRRLVEAGKDVTVVIAGQPWESPSLYSDLVSELGLESHVRLSLGYIPEPEVQAYFAAADLAVYPYTHFDAQSAAATLALSFGVPMIVSDVGGLRDLVDDPRAVVPAGEPGPLAEAIEAVLDDAALRSKLAADARHKAAGLDWGVIARRTAELYRAVLA